MSDDCLQATLVTTVALAWQAADVAMAHYRPGIAAQSKGGDPTNLVTQADKDVNALIVAGLNARHPEDAVLAEESQDSHSYEQRRGARRLWCVDPIDGTREFVAHTGDFAVMIGLAIDGAARLGVVLQPTKGRVFAGCIDGAGAGTAYTATRDGAREPLRANSVALTSTARLMVSRSYQSKGITALAAGLGVQTLVPMGSVGLKMAMLAAGHAELYISLSTRTHEWDACGPEAILRAAGGTVTDLDGVPLAYNKPHTQTLRGIAASNGVLHGPCLQQVARLEAQRQHGAAQKREA